MYGVPRLVVGWDTLDSLIGRGCITRVKKYESPLHDDYELTSFGQHWAEKNESAYLDEHEKRFHSEMDRREALSSIESANSSAARPQLLKPIDSEIGHIGDPSSADSSSSAVVRPAPDWTEAATVVPKPEVLRPMQRRKKVESRDMQVLRTLRTLGIDAAEKQGVRRTTKGG
jgi:hypothetical protein